MAGDLPWKEIHFHDFMCTNAGRLIILNSKNSVVADTAIEYLQQLHDASILYPVSEDSVHQWFEKIISRLSLPVTSH